MVKWILVKWFWLVRNSAAAARMGWEAAGKGIPDLGKFRG